MINYLIVKSFVYNIKTITICLIGICLISCDPVRVLIIKSKNNTNSSVTIYTNGDFPIMPRYKGDINPPKTTIKVPYEDTIIKREKMYSTGVGGWTLGHIDWLHDNIDSIVIVNSGRSKTYKDEKLYKYLKKQRHGIFKHVLTIKSK